MKEPMPRRHVRMIQPRFVPLILSGAKLNTIRPTPQREIRPGDILDIRQWEAKAYRSKQIRIVEVEVADVSRIEIGDSWVRRWNGLVDDLDAFARADGFDGWNDMAAWFDAVHGLPFDGVIIRWKPVYQPATDLPTVRLAEKEETK